MALTYGILDGEYNARQFSEMFAPLWADSVADHGNKFLLTLRAGLSVRLSDGYMYADGHWLKSDEPIVFNLELSDPVRTRYDDIVLVMNEEERTADIQLLTDINPDAISVDGYYITPLYVIRVQSGATTLYDDDITDKRELLKSLNELSNDTLGAYQYIDSGIHDEVSEMVATADQALDVADVDIRRIDAEINAKTGVSLGAVVCALSIPEPYYAWILCDGENVPTEYSDLIALIGNTTPIINFSDVRFHAYIYAGAQA